MLCSVAGMEFFSPILSGREHQLQSYLLISVMGNSETPLNSLFMVSFVPVLEAYIMYLSSWKVFSSTETETQNYDRQG